MAVAKRNKRARPGLELLELDASLPARQQKAEDLIGENDLLRPLAKMLVERVLEAEMTGHLGLDKSGEVSNGIAIPWPSRAPISACWPERCCTACPSFFAMFKYRKAGIMLMDLQPETRRQSVLFDACPMVHGRYAPWPRTVAVYPSCRWGKTGAA